MKRTILYFPNIDIPDGQWIRNSLLYWDEISSIVPESPEFNSLSPSIEYLSSVGQYRTMNPTQLLKSELYKEFETEFTLKINDYITSRPKRIGTVFRNVDGKHKIHTKKLNYMMIHLLKESGVLSRKDSDKWVEMDGQAANLYMTILAKYLAIGDENQTVIGTDQNQYYDLSYLKCTNQNRVDNNEKPFLSNHLRNILPTPLPNVPYEEILDFKKRHRDELLQFRTIINEFESQIANSDSIIEIKEKTISYKEKIELGTSEIAKALKGSYIKFVFSSLSSIVNPKNSLILTSLLTPLSTHVPINIDVMGASISGGIEIGTNYVDMKESIKTKLSDNSFVYLYKAQQEGLISGNSNFSISQI
ncbi:DUF6236 family protein [Bacillus sp. EB01]|uniref:DUF6236 family protein n=1 Tax=Bacillus sp. EB01 TaxID=1347086 RepID=UPI0005C5D565|nr:DUF6236 family protein [Bacillus sp. EB01]